MQVFAPWDFTQLGYLAPGETITQKTMIPCTLGNEWFPLQGRTRKAGNLAITSTDEKGIRE